MICNFMIFSESIGSRATASATLLFKPQAILPPRSAVTN